MNEKSFPFLKAIVAGVLFTTVSCSYLPSFDPTVIPGVSIRDTRSYIVIQSSAAPSRTGFMFYPGAFVDPHAYVVMLSTFAVQGYTVMIVKVPANLAVIDADAGYNLRSAISAIDRWVIGGHSLGGAMAATSVKRHPADYAGLILMAAYPASSDTLATWTRPVISLSASKDGLATPEKISNTIDLLPAGKWIYAGDRNYPSTNAGYTVFHVIPGGCHAQFGSYGAQDGDGIPAISASAQHAEIADYMNEFFIKNGLTNR